MPCRAAERHGGLDVRRRHDGRAFGQRRLDLPSQPKRRDPPRRAAAASAATAPRRGIRRPRASSWKTPGRVPVADAAAPRRSSGATARRPARRRRRAPSTAISRGFRRALHRRPAGSREPVRDRVHVPRRPRPPLAFEEQLADLAVLIADRLLGVDGDEVEDERQRVVFADHAGDEMLVALDRIARRGSRPGRPRRSSAAASLVTRLPDVTGETAK